MFESLAAALSAGLQIWQSLEKRKYIDKLMKLRAEYREEYNKDLADRSDAVLDNLKFELCNLALAFSASVGIEDVKN